MKPMTIWIMERSAKGGWCPVHITGRTRGEMIRTAEREIGVSWDLEVRSGRVRARKYEARPVEVGE